MTITRSSRAISSRKRLVERLRRRQLTRPALPKTFVVHLLRLRVRGRTLRTLSRLPARPRPPRGTPSSPRIAPESRREGRRRAVRSGRVLSSAPPPRGFGRRGRGRSSRDRRIGRCRRRADSGRLPARARIDRRRRRVAHMREHPCRRPSPTRGRARPPRSAMSPAVTVGRRRVLAVLVVLAHVDNRQRPDRGHVHRLEEQPLVRGPVAEEAGGDLVGPARLGARAPLPWRSPKLPPTIALAPRLPVVGIGDVHRAALAAAVAGAFPSNSANMRSGWAPFARQCPWPR